MPKLGLGLSLPQTLKVGGPLIPSAGLFLWLKADAGTTQNASLLNSLLAYWNLDNDSWLDSSGNGNTLTAYNEVTVGTGLISDCAEIFSANGSYLDKSSTNFNIGTADASISIWINPASYGSGGYNDFAGSVFDFRNNGGGKEWLLIFNDVGNLRIWQTPTSYETNAQIPLNTWTHIVVSRNAGTTSFYINGSLDGTFADTENFQSQIFTLGGPVDVPGDPEYLHYDGRIDEVGVWNRALTGAEITSLYNSGAGKAYPFAGTTQSVNAWADQSGNGNNVVGIAGYTASSINDFPTIDFNGGDYLQNFDFPNLNQNNTIFIVIKPNNGGNGTIYSQGNATNGLFFDGSSTPIYACPNIQAIITSSKTINDGVSAILSVETNTYDSVLRINGTSYGSNFFDGFESENTILNIGCNTNSGDYNLHGQIAEIVIYNRALTTPERQQVEAYLGNKYSIDLTGTIFNNTFNSTVDAQNTTWALGPFQEIATAPTGCPNPNCLHLLQGGAGTASLYSQQGFGQLGMLDLTQSYTIECWFYVTDINNFFHLTRGDGGDPIYILFNGDRSITVFTNPESISTNSSIFNLNSWNNFAVTVSQESSKTIIYINGLNCAEMNYTTNTNGHPARWEWGVVHDFNNGYDIYISNMRWTQKVLYTSNFTPSFTNFPNAQL